MWRIGKKAAVTLAAMLVDTPDKTLFCSLNVKRGALARAAGTTNAKRFSKSKRFQYRAFTVA
tara:strand:- start:473 stop:658 length:186 start_codon:yes stop_codon:yes gene_type:complete